MWIAALPMALVALAQESETSRGAPARVQVPGSVHELEFLPLPTVDPEAPTVWLARTELTWDAYDPWFMGLDLPPAQRVGIEATSRPSKPYGAVDRGFGHRGYPAIGMTSKAAALYAEWLSERTGGRFRLPTESEWERAAGAVATDDLEAVAWVYENSNDQTQPVATKPASPHGFHDLLGNAGEWCRSADGDDYVLRGGSYYDFAEDVGPRARFTYDISWQRRDPQIPKSSWWLSDGPFVGMRLVCEELPPDDPILPPDSPREESP